MDNYLILLVPFLVIIIAFFIVIMISQGKILHAIGISKSEIKNLRNNLKEMKDEVKENNKSMNLEINEIKQTLQYHISTPHK